MSTADTLRRDGARTLHEAGVDSASHDAAHLLAYVLDVDPGRLILVDGVGDDDADRYAALLARRATREPLQHITGRAWFDGLELAVGPGVFVPRPETELIVEWVTRELAVNAVNAAGLRIADLCAGSGALGLALAHRLPGADVTLVEKSPAALPYLRRNAESSRARVVPGDATDAAAMARVLGTCDVIVSNPPYVPSASPVSAEVRHDPPDAVFSGADGMGVIRALIPIVATALAPGGLFAVEHDDQTAPQVVDALAADGRFAAVGAHDDLAGRPRFVTAVRSRGDAGTDPDPDRARMEQ